MKFFKLVGVAVAMAAMSGCVTVEGTREQLKSGDANEVKKAERNIVRIAVDGGRQDAMPRYTVEQRISFVELTSKNDVLLEVVDGLVSWRPYENVEVLDKALSRIDFSDASARERVINHFGSIPYEGSKNIARKVAERIVEAMDESALIEHMKKSGALRNDMHNRLIAIVQDPKLISALMSGEIEVYGGVTLQLAADERKTLESKLLAQIDKITDEKLIVQLLTPNSDGDVAVIEAQAVKRLVEKLPVEKRAAIAIEIANKQPKYCSYRWENAYALYVAAYILPLVSDEASRLKIAMVMADKICECEKLMSERGKVSKKGKDLAKFMIDNLSQTSLAKILSRKGSAWMLVADGISEAVA